MRYLGLDIGALFTKAVLLDAKGEIERSWVERHHGDPRKSLGEWLERVKLEGEIGLGVTGQHRSTLENVSGGFGFDTVRATVVGAARLGTGMRWVIDVGGGSLTAIELDHDGRFLSFSSNSVCAAGTGSFLDEQARRLGIDYDVIATMEPVENPPSIASRCAVFAKSDLIHRQQEGHSREAMWSGLCQGLASTLLQTLFKGRPVEGPVLVVGGVSRNRDVVRWIRQLSGAEVRTAPDGKGHLCTALGAAWAAKEEGFGRPWADLNADLAAAAGGGAYRSNGEVRRSTPSPAPRNSLVPQGRALVLERTKYPSFAVAESWVTENGDEVRIHRWPEGEVVRAGVGVDVGSTSTKCVLVDEREKVVLDIYRRTQGDPIGATRKLLRALGDALAKGGKRLEPIAVGTTGSGRKLIGMLLGADAIINEITAHAAGGMTDDPDVETIFEIGGQDSKYIRLKDGHACDANMNYVCAAGTGSFVEEQATKLGYKVQDVGPAVEGIAPPLTSDRCTVFMEQDVLKLLRQGYSREEALAGVMRSVVRNYLTKVVGRRPVSKGKVAFMGATARNRGLVAAFEQELGVEMVVSPVCHVMGAMGVACLARRQQAALGRSTFRGLDCLDGEIDIRQERCELCQNKCAITYARSARMAEPASWGYLCGRDPDEKKVRKLTTYELFEKRQQLWRTVGRQEDARWGGITIGLPRTLHLFDELPRWRAFFETLGAHIVLSRETDAAARQATTNLVASEFCFPAKIVHGHVANLLAKRDVDFVFMPHRIASKRNRATTDAQFCPYVQGLPGVLRAALRRSNIDDTKVLTPIVDERMPEKAVVKYLTKVVGPVLGVDAKRVAAAWRAGNEAQAEFMRRVQSDTQQVLDRLAAENKPAFVIVGRPYNLYDPGLNVGLPRKIAEHGLPVIPLDGLGFRESDIEPIYHNTFWNFAQKALAGVKRISQSPNLYPVYLTNFGCGPDSFNLTYAERTIGRKPMLILELDEHAADAGYVTRVEAFIDVVREVEARRMAEFHAGKREAAAGERPNPVPTERKEASGERVGEEWKKRRCWFPPMHQFGTPLLAAVFRRHGLNAAPLPVEDREAFEIGRRLTRGTECLPTAVTIGAFVKKLRELGADPKKEALFMPTAEGPCRFGQYCTLHKLILQDLGWGDVEIVSPSSYNNYQGLPELVRKDMWSAILASDVLFKAVCKARPYEREPGAVDRAAMVQQTMLERAIESGRKWEPELARAVEALAALRGDGPPRPLVGVVGEIYVRCNSYSNGDVIRAVEAAGGEAWLAPLGEWILYTSWMARNEALNGSNVFNPLELAVTLIKDRYMHSEEERMYHVAGPFLADRHEPSVGQAIEAGKRYIPPEFAGEAILTMGRAILFAHQGAAMVVNCAPFGCMPGTLTSSCMQEVQAETNVPMVSMFYDGDLDLNTRIASYLANLPRAQRAVRDESRLRRDDVGAWA
jgi:predicted CoA-substrate-specific enzyme activase